MTLKEAIKWVETDYCEEYGEGHPNGFYEALEIILKKVKTKPKVEKWEEEFEDEIIETGDSENEWINLMNYDFEQLIKKYNLFNKKILIKARKGKIVIERIK